MISYSYEDLNGQVHPVATDFTSVKQRIDTPEEGAMALGAPVGSFVANPVQHRITELNDYDDHLLARWGIIRTVTADPTPPPVRREVSKLVVQARLKAIGKLGAAFAALQSDPDVFGRWFMEGPNIYVDDPEALGMFSAIGMTSAQITAVLA